MRKPSIKYGDLALELTRVTSMREQLVLEAFGTLEFRHGALAQTLMESIGSRQRAAHWMCSHQRAFDGRSAYEVLADGDEDSVWDQIPGYRSRDAIERLAETGMAY